MKYSTNLNELSKDNLIKSAQF